MLQINTSEEEGKGGFVEMEEVLKSIEFIREQCNFLKFTGLMTIGSADNSKRAAEENSLNPDFEKEKGVKGAFKDKSKLTPSSLLLYLMSMMMQKSVVSRPFTDLTDDLLLAV